MFISIHIPKTAGTTIAYMLDYGTQRRILYWYDKDYKNVDDEDKDMWLKHKEFVEARFDVIHGHFHYKKFAEVFPDANYIVCLRHPVERIVSQWKHIIGENKSDVADKYRKGNYSIIDFVSSHPSVLRALSVHVEGRKLSDYAHIFLTEDLLRCWHRFEQKFNFNRNDSYMAQGLPKLNPATNRKIQVSVSEKEKQKIYSMCGEDVELYKEALALIKNY